MLMFIPTYGILLLIRFFAVITKYTVLDEQRREAKEGKSQRQNPRSFTHGATSYTATCHTAILWKWINPWEYRRHFWTTCFNDK